MSEKVIELVHLQKQFGENTVLRDINLSVSKGEVLSIIGASGSGKSTMLRCINLLETPPVRSCTTARTSPDTI